MLFNSIDFAVLGKISVISDLGSFNIEIYNQSGILIQKNSTLIKALEMDVSKLIPGIYFLRYQTRVSRSLKV